MTENSPVPPTMENSPATQERRDEYREHVLRDELASKRALYRLDQTAGWPDVWRAEKALSLGLPARASQQEIDQKQTELTSSLHR